VPTNAAIAEGFAAVADLLEIRGENPFRVRAYRRAAQTLESLSEEVAAVAARGALEGIPGIGKDLAGKIQEFLASGRIAYLEELRREIPAGVVDLMAIPGVGPKTAKLLFDRLGVDGLDRLEAAARGGELGGLPGIKAKTIANILKGIEVVRRGRERMPIGRALPLAETLVAALKAGPAVDRIEVAGSVRRRRETVKDLDLLVTSTDPAAVMARFVAHPEVREVLAHGETKSSVLLRAGIQADLRVVEPAAFGAALQYFTGSKGHNVRTRELANRRGLKLSEYGVFREADGARVAGATEAEVYGALGLPWIPPELREDLGEVEAAQGGRLPRLIELADLRGDLHLHTTWSDGTNSLAEMVEAARARGHEYMLVSDHSKSTGVAGGLSEERLLEQVREIRALRRRGERVRVLAGCEVDVRADGSLDYPDAVLAQLDLVIATVHSGFKMTREQMTARIVRALQNRHVRCLAHPTGRLLGARAGYEVDLEAVIRAAVERGVALEINASPERLDLNDLHARQAKEAGARLVINTDAHAIPHLDHLAYGVAVARRAWLTPADVVNAMPLRELEAWLRRDRRGRG
jgi:DNA polymerase (family 10)